MGCVQPIYSRNFSEFYQKIKQIRRVYRHAAGMATARIARSPALSEAKPAATVAVATPTRVSLHSTPGYAGRRTA